MRQIAIASGKGGVGKTSIAASFASFAKAVFADCDVDASNLPIIFKPEIIKKEDFYGMDVASVDESKCIKCMECYNACRFDAITEEIEIIEEKCEGCGVCEYVCPVDAIEMVPRKSGEVYVSKSRFGWIVHAELKAGEETSGKLVSVVRQKAMEVAKENGYDLIIIDSSAGIGCPVIASITGVNLVVIVVEPTMAAIHDMKRIMNVANHFKVPYVVCINKYDLNEEKAKEIEEFCKENGIEIVGKIPYNKAFTKAIVNGKSIAEYDEGLAEIMKKIWENVERKIEES
ncbi:MAG: ATP-binding protein [Thermoplasmata archaeon]|jgi:MinD superfamily P-loop ATPase|nr:ATP-binding protein [Thermoplasmata archaeon]